jgi:hypothetical protein
VQAPLTVLQAWLVGQSVVAEHPHVPLLRHRVPEVPPTHETHAAPVAPHSVGAVPGAHFPALQHPPLHG